ncbi:UbiA family prenyltransferase [Methanolobus sp.]|uniref:UbiA family prenyltransferase n=1 Tax=Methanolobus sp. TaxID=1874737 RepID=UPI0025E1D438|nr:UbiA family prenyltransferase [Methanolobus sp.]
MSSNSTLELPVFTIRNYEQNTDLLGTDLIATFNLLKSSILVSISGALRIYIAFLLIQAQYIVLHCIAGGLIIYSVYTLDRAMDSEEDAVNRAELRGASKKFTLFICLLCFVIGASILATGGLLSIAFLPLVTGYLYTKGLNIGSLKIKLKGGMGIKNTVVGLTWGAFIAGIAGHSAQSSIATLIVFLFFGMKLFVNSTIYDFKDIKGDSLAGIKTLPVSLGENKAKALIFCIHTASHLMLLFFLLKGTIGFEPVILTYSLFAGIVSILNFANPVDIETSKRRAKRLFVVDGESGSIVGIRTIGNLIM